MSSGRATAHCETHRAQPFPSAGGSGPWRSRDLTFAEDGSVAKVCPEGRRPGPCQKARTLGGCPTTRNCQSPSDDETCGCEFPEDWTCGFWVPGQGESWDASRVEDALQ